MQDGVDGVRCEQRAQCGVSGAAIVLTMAGSFDTVSVVYTLQNHD